MSTRNFSKTSQNIKGFGHRTSVGSRMNFY